ncbi:Vegetative incompatibility protein HET-E-1 [Psilocybe cubensis]|uniref:Vegetative incompatibility protein HET-E-1 n=1 Tax=Psilocybe cubensis TaxID=181762 RepID=A0ACB8GPJ4_PSICU|nr:Vegetative incompatibility protein HET-E-1 [Psilocybe cubensis]KAH9476959.1 Vegetative incompatibility protein HET-E-1 [Psilocybe cubensis]
MTSIDKDSDRSHRILENEPQDIGRQQVEILVVKAINLPILKNKLGKERRFYVTITDGTTTKKSKIMNSLNRSVMWDQTMDGFTDTSNIKLSLFAEYQMHKDKLLGSVKINAKPSIVPDLTVVVTVHMHDLVQVASDALREIEAEVVEVNILAEWKGAMDNIVWVMDVIGNLAQARFIHMRKWFGWFSLPFQRHLLIAQFEHDENIRALINAMRSAFDLVQAESLLKNIKPNSHQALTLKVMLRHINICSDVIKRYAEDNGFKKMLLLNVSGGIAKEIQTLCETLGKLRQDLLDGAVISTQIAVEKIKRNIDIKMNEFPYKPGWRSISNVERNGCLPGTRTDFLNYITRWVDDPSSKPGLVLLGKAGTGKSTIGHEIALRFQLEDRLGSYFSFFRTEKSKHEDHHLFTTIIHDLARRYPSFKSAIGSLIKDDKLLQSTDNFNLLFDTLLLGALRRISMDGPILIIIDALDESAHPTGRAGLAAFLTRSISKLPTNFRVFITSRLDGDIKDWFANSERSLFEVLEMDDPKLAKTVDDIRLFFEDHHNLPPVLFQEYGLELIEKSQGLFQWAAVACAHINEPPPGWTQVDCLRGLLVRQHADKKYAQPLNRPLYELYDTVLAVHFNTEIACDRFRSVMGHLLAAMVPFSVNLLTAIRKSIPSSEQEHEEAVLVILKYLGSLLSNVTAEDHELPIVPLHTSFRDYLTEVVKEGDSFYVNLQKSHYDLACSCLYAMLKELKFNICALESSYISNHDIEDLDHRIQKHIRPVLLYACQFWSDHLNNLPFGEVIFHHIHRFLEEKFLFWLEVMSVTDTLPLGVQALTVLKQWMMSCTDSSTVSGDKWNQLNTLIMDARRFIRYFSTPIAVSAPHIYISALPFTPTASKVYQNYACAFLNTISLDCGQQINWHALEMSIALTGCVNSMAFSPDGRYIVASLSDWTIRIFDATTGTMKGKPLTGPKGRFATRSVAFSHDGKWVASGSYDGDVHLWNASTYEMEKGPLTGHTKVVLSVAFSSDGQWVVSGSYDSKIIVWNVLTGKVERGPYTGHAKGVLSVDISPDGKYIVSGSQDKEIRIWNLSTGELEHGPFVGHTDAVNSVAFSPDGQKIVSGSNDRTVILWNAVTGEIDQGPLTGHLHAVYSVAFSPDAKRIVSGSLDQTLRIWHVNTGQTEQILHAHSNGGVDCVAFSPDGERIASGSQMDQTLRLWDSSSTGLNKPSDQRVPFVLQDGEVPSWNNTSIRSIAFSPDGLLVASGSNDATICLWDISTAQYTTTLVGNEDKGFKSAAFSPDGQWIAYGSCKPIRLWNLSTGKHATLTCSLSLRGHTNSVASVVFFPDGKRLVSGSEDETIRIWDTSTGELLGGPFIVKQSVCSLAVSPDGMWILCGSLEPILQLVKVSTGEVRQELTIDDQFIGSVGVSSNGLLIACGPEILLFDTLTGVMTPGRTFKDWSTSSVASVGFSPDGSQIVCASVDDNLLRIWDSSSGELEYTLPSEHTEMIDFVSFSPDGTKILSSARDRAIRVMSARPITDTTSEICFNDLSIIDRDGWIREDDDKLLLWIPTLHRPGLYHPNVPILIICDIPTRLNTSNFVHGLDWATCYTG